MFKSIKSMYNRLVSNKAFLPVLFIALATSCGLSYLSARSIMVAGNTWLYIVESNVTLNFVLFLFMWGLMSDRITKGKSKTTQWAVTLLGILALFAFFRFVAGYETIFG